MEFNFACVFIKLVVVKAHTKTTVCFAANMTGAA
jgi:hypothetical protein